MLTIGPYCLDPLEFGRIRLDGGAMFGVVPRPLWQRTNPPDERNRIALALRGLLLRGEGKIIVVDAGVGDSMPAKQRELYAVEASHQQVLAELGRHGVAAEQVTHVLCTHLHFDHVAGFFRLDREGTIRPTFPSAVHFIGSEQLHHALEPTVRDRASYLRAELEAPIQAVEVHLVKNEGELLPGLRVELCDGHTPGQLVPIVHSAERTLCYPSDLVPTTSHVRLAYTMGYDLWAQRLLEEKAGLLGRAADEGWLCCFEHDPVTPLTRIVRENDDFAIALDEELLALGKEWHPRT